MERGGMMLIAVVWQAGCRCRKLRFGRREARRLVKVRECVSRISAPWRFVETAIHSKPVN
jgi:hypothetical protein